MPQAPGNPAEVGQNHDARKAVSATLSVLRWSGAIFLPSSSKVTMRSFYSCPFHCKPRPSRVSLEFPGLENISKVPGNRAEVGENHNSRKAISATFSVLKWSWAIFRPRSSKVSAQSFYLCPFHCKPRPSGVSLGFPGLENISKIPGNNIPRKAISATLSVLKWSWAIFRPRSSKVSVQKVFLCPFHCKPRP